MSGLPPLALEVYDRDLSYLCSVARPQGFAGTMRHNAAGGAAFALDSDEEAAEALTEKGARMVARYRYDRTDPSLSMHVVGGPVTQVDLGGVIGAETSAFTVQDDWSVLSGIYCMPVPASGLGSQGGVDTVYTATGPAETVVKTLVSANKGRITAPLTVAASHGWGETITVQARMHKLTDKIFPALDYAHVGISVRQVGTSLVVDAYQPKNHGEIGVRSGILAKAPTGSLLRPTVSQVLVVAGDAPLVMVVRNTAVEAEWGFCGQERLDVTDSVDPTYLTAKAWEILNAGAAQSSVQVELAETEDWRLGGGADDFYPGDEFTLALPGGGLIPEAIREVDISWTTGADGGLKVEPSTGQGDTSPDQLTNKAVAMLARAYRNDKAGRV